MTLYGCEAVAIMQYEDPIDKPL